MLALRPELGEHPTCVSFFSCPNQAHTVVQNQSTFEKRLHVHPPGPMKPHAKGLFTWQQHRSVVASHSWDHPLPPIQFAPFLSSWRWVSHCSPLGWRRERGCGIPKHKGAARVSLLCLNLPPTQPPSCLRYAWCSMQGTRSGRLPGPTWAWREPERRSTGSVLRTE